MLSESSLSMITEYSRRTRRYAMSGELHLPLTLIGNQPCFVIWNNMTCSLSRCYSMDCSLDFKVYNSDGHWMPLDMKCYLSSCYCMFWSLDFKGVTGLVCINAGNWMPLDMKCYLSRCYCVLLT